MLSNDRKILAATRVTKEMEENVKDRKGKEGSEDEKKVERKSVQDKLG